MKKTARSNAKPCKPVRGKRNNFKNRDREAKFEAESSKDELKSKVNDPNWYAADDAILRDAASIPFSWATGTLLDLGVETITIPGICALKLTPTFGRCTSQSDPINVASTAVYSFIRHANSGSSNYDSPDLMLYIMSMSQIYSYINMLQRAYGVAQLYAQGNRYLPDGLMTAMGIDPVDVQSHLADFRYRINVLINKAASMAVPSDFTIFQRQAFLYQNIYTEGTSIKDQLYMYVPHGFWYFGLNPTTKAGQLNYVQFKPSACISGATNSLFTVSQLFSLGNALLQPILGDEDMNIMSGDILKAYGSDRLIKLAEVPPEYRVAPVFDIGVLEQMKNAVVIPSLTFANYSSINFNGVSNLSRPAVMQNNNKGYLLSQPQIKSGSLGSIYQDDTETNLSAKGGGALDLMAEKISLTNRLLTTTTDSTGPELVIESSRLMTVADRIPGTANASAASGAYLYPGSEICVACELWYSEFNSALGGAMTFAKSVIYSDMYLSNPSKLEDAPAQVSTTILTRHGRFHFAPGINIYSYNGSDPSAASASISEVAWVGQMYNVDNYAVMTKDMLKRLHEVALLNMLHVPSIARV